MKAGPRNINACQLLVADGNSRWVIVFVECRLHAEPRFGGGAGDKVHDSFVGNQWPALPVLRDEAEQAVLDLAPLAGAWRKVAHVQG